MIARFREAAPLVLSVYLILFPGCESGGDALGCEPGEVRECPCGGGEPDGVQACAEDGDSFGPCGCGGGDADGDTDADADGDADDEPDTQCVGQDDFTPCEIVTEPDRFYDICVNQTCVSPGCGDATCNVPGPHFPPPPDGPRDDFLRTEAVTGEPAVLDEATVLEWQGCAAGLGGTDCDEGQLDLVLWEDALDYCDGLSWGNYADWRLPDEWELLSIVDYSSVPAIDEAAFPATPVFTTWEFGDVGFWTSSTLPGLQSGTHGDHGKLRFYAGYLEFSSNYTTEPQPGAVRCVRGEPVPHGEHFERDLSDEEHPLVTDSVTGLVWQGCARGQSGPACDGEAVGSNWEEAVSYCESLEWAGYYDWRLPGTKEIWSIVETRNADWHPFDTAAFPSTPDGFWTSATSTDIPLDAWCLSNLSLSTCEKGSSLHARCVREGE
jgi:hypothetical protein